MTDVPDSRERIQVDAGSQILSVPHLGMTLRSLLGAAAAAGPVTAENCTWTVKYKSVNIGTIRLKVFSDAKSG